VWQGRFKAFPLQDDDHLATVLRYVVRNRVRAELVARAEHWKWSSLGAGGFVATTLRGVAPVVARHTIGSSILSAMPSATFRA